MPSIHRQAGKPNWFCAFTIRDSQTGENKRVFRSTKTRDKKQALEICRAWHKASLKARNGKLSADAAREIIARGVADVFLAANAEPLSSATVRQWCATWAKTKSIETEPSTHARYVRITERFSEFLGRPISLTPKQTEILVAARDDSNRLNQIIENLLDMGRMQAGRGLMDLHPAAPEQLVDGALPTALAVV
jgi:signal transduction histidine kinase